MDFKSLKSNSGKRSLSALTEQLNKVSSSESAKKGDDRFWKATVDKAGNGYAVIRFLDSPQNEDVPFVRVFDHGFKGPGGWYIENSLTTIGKQDPVSEFNTKLWNSTTDDNSPERKRHVIKSAAFISFPTFMLFRIKLILKMKERYSYSNMVRRTLIS